MNKLKSQRLINKLEDLEFYDRNKDLDDYDWYIISTYYRLSNKFFLKYFEYLREYTDLKITQNFNNNEKIYNTLFSKNLSKDESLSILCSQKLNSKIILKYFNKYIFRLIHTNQNIPIELLKKHENKISWSYFSRNYKYMNEEILKTFEDKLNFFSILINENMNINKEKLILNNIDLFRKKLSDKINIYKHNTNISNLQRKLLNFPLISKIENCGVQNRSIYIVSDKPDIICIGCTQYTKEKAIKAINEKYIDNNELRLEYIDKVEECFEEAKIIFNNI